MQSAASPKPSMADLVAKARAFGVRYLKVLRKFWWIPVATVSVSVSIAFWKGIHLIPTYTSSAQMVITGQFQIEGAARIAEAENYMGTQFALLLSEQVAQRARTKIQLQHPEWIPVPVSVDVAQTPRTSFLMLHATGTEPLYTQAFLDSVMQEYMGLKKEMRAEKSDSMTSAIRNQLILLEKETDADEQELVRFQKESNIGFLQTQGNSAGDYLALLDRQLAGLKTELNLLDTLDLDQNIERDRSASVRNTSSSSNQKQEGSLSTLDPSLANNNYGPMIEYQRGKQELLMLQSKRAELLKTMKPRNPKVVEIEEQIAKAQALMENYKQQSVDILKTRREAIEYQIKNLQAVISEWRGKAMDLSLKLAEYDRIKLKLERDKNQYDRLITTLRSVDVFKNVEQEPLSILENASPAASVKAGLAKSIFGGFATGLLAGLAILFLIDKTNDKISSAIECRSNFKEHTLLGQIPHENMEGDLALLVPYDPRHELLEAFRALRSSILFVPVEGTRPKALMIASAMHEEGKTAIAANFAGTLAFSGAKTLLVDCNLSNGRLHELFDTSPDKGLLNVLQQQIPWTEAVIQTSIDNLFLLPRGEALAYPAEHYFGAFLRNIYQEFDYIIFDTAPVLEDVDVLSFAPLIDGVLFVVRVGCSSGGDTTRALDLLNARQVNVLGLICNDAV